MVHVDVFKSHAHAFVSLKLYLMIQLPGLPNFTNKTSIIKNEQKHSATKILSEADTFFI